MKKLILYPKRQVAAQDFKHVKAVTVPNQSLTLAQIIKRFMRKESLPLMHEAVYEDRFGDLEKLQHLDITEKHDRSAELGRWIKKVEQRAQAQREKEKAAEQPKPDEPKP